MTKSELFEKLANPNKDGVSRWVSVSEFNGKYDELKFNNGWSWGRKGRTLDKKYKTEVIRSGNSIISIRLNGFKDDFTKGSRLSYTKTRDEILSDMKKECYAEIVNHYQRKISNL